MTNESFLTQLGAVRRLLAERLAAVRRGEAVFGNAQELEALLQSLDEAESEVRSGVFRWPREHRRLPGVREILDTWPFEDEVGKAFMALATAYRDL
jgi:hypothetical protein